MPSYNKLAESITSLNQIESNNNVFTAKCEINLVKYYLFINKLSLSNTQETTRLKLDIIPIDYNKKLKNIQIPVEDVLNTYSYFNEQINTNIAFLSAFKAKTQKIIKTSKNYCIINYVNTVKKGLKLKLEKLFVIFESEEIRINFQNIISDYLNEFVTRPKSLAIFINPISGHGKGVDVYFSKVAPVFELAKIRCAVTITQKANHAYELIQTLDLSNYDGIISVGGDGLFSEVFTSLLNRTQAENDVDRNDFNSELIAPNKVIGIIPAGSTDAACYCTTGSNDAVTSSLQIALGKKMNIDVISAYDNQSLLSYCTTLLGYGYFGDVAHDSSSLRWMGPFRYTWTGFKNVLRNKSYSGKIRFSENKNLDHSPLDGKLCVTNCTICISSTTTTTQKKLGTTVSIKKELNVNTKLIRTTTVTSEESGVQEYGEISGEFIAINCVNMTCRCAKSKYGISPSCHTSNGCADLILVRKTSRFNYIRYLLRLSSKHSFVDLPFVEIYRLNEFEFTAPYICENDMDGSSRSRNNRTSKWNCDGEILNKPSIKAKVNKQLLEIYASGLNMDSTISC